MDIQQLQEQMDDAMLNGDFQKAHHYKSLIELQNEYNQIYNKRQDQMSLGLNPPMWKVGGAFPVDDLIQGQGNVITWSTSTGVEPDAEFKRRKEEDQRRNLKLFIHFAKLLCEQYPNWTVAPDPNDPFKNVTMTHSNGKYRIESAYPDNAVKLWGVEKDQDREDANFRRRNGIPNALRGTPTPETVPTYTFFGWAIGMNDIPNWVKE